jgi:hypothetical protein
MSCERRRARRKKKWALTGQLGKLLLASLGRFRNDGVYRLDEGHGERAKGGGSVGDGHEGEDVGDGFRHLYDILVVEARSDGRKESMELGEVRDEMLEIWEKEE